MLQPKPRFSLYFPHEVLLIEIDRRCTFADCTGRNLIGLTKPEAIEYRGFDCSHCECWNDDQLKESELPYSWRDLISPDTVN